MAQTLPAQEVMTAPITSENDAWPESWRHARRAAIGAMLLPWLILTPICLDGWLRGGRPERAAARWMGCMARSTPSLWPAGDAMHYPPESAP